MDILMYQEQSSKSEFAFAERNAKSVLRSKIRFWIHPKEHTQMSMTIAGRRNNNGFLDTEEELYTRNVCFLKTFDTIWLFSGILTYPRPVNQLDEMY